MKNIPLHGSLKIKYKGKILKIAFKEDIKLEGDMGSREGGLRLNLINTLYV